MSFKARSALLTIAFYSLLTIGCGDTFRPIAIPIVQQGGQPQANRQAIVLSDPGPGTSGSATHINVSGNTNVGQVTLEVDPVHAALVNGGGIIVVVNKGSENLNFYTTFSPTTATPPALISLNAGSVPVYIFSNVVGSIFVAESGSNKVGVVNLGSPTGLTAEIPVGTAPVALNGSPDGTRLYVANSGDNTVSVVDTGTNALVPSTAALPNPIVVGGTPSFLVVSPDGTRLYSINKSGNSVSIIDTSNDSVTNVAVGSAPNDAVFDRVNRRVWVTNSTGTTVSAINADTLSANFGAVTNIDLTSACGAPLPTSITVLADGSRAYVADSGCGKVSVINTLSNTVSSNIVVGATPLFIASSPDSSKVYVANNGSNTVSIIQPSNDTVSGTIAVPAKPVFVFVTP